MWLINVNQSWANHICFVSIFILINYVDQNRKNLNFKCIKNVLSSFFFLNYTSLGYYKFIYRLHCPSVERSKQFAWRWYLNLAGKDKTTWDQIEEIIFLCFRTCLWFIPICVHNWSCITSNKREQSHTMRPKC